MRTEKIDEWGAFHGYWVRDLAEAEPRFGGVEALRALSDGLHARQMRLVLDMVWNHTDYDAPLLTEHPPDGVRDVRLAAPVRPVTSDHQLLALFPARLP